MEEERISIEDDDLVTQQCQGDDSVFIDVPDSSVDNIPTREYSDDNIDDIGVTLAPNRGEEEEGGRAEEDDNPQEPHPSQTDIAAATNASVAAVDDGDVDGFHHQTEVGGQLKATPETVAEGGEEEEADKGEASPEVVVAAAAPEDAVVEEEPIEEDTPVTSTPKAKGSKSPGKTLKQKLGQIPARLSKLSIFNALRSGTYVVNEPPPPPPSAADNDDDNDDVEPADNNDDNKTAEASVAANNDDKDSEEKGVVSAKKKARTMTDNGVVASEDSPQVAMTRMPEETPPPEEQPEDLPVIPQQPAMAIRKPHSVHRSALTKLLCGLYALMLVVFGVVFAVANSLTVKERQHLYYLEVFLLYLYLGSLATLLYFQICILRGKQVRNAYLDNSIRVIIRRSQDNLQLSPCPSRKDNPPPLGTTTLDKDFEEKDVGLEPRKELLDQMSTLSNASDFRSHLVLPPDGQVAHVGEGINFYLRLGALAFSIGSVTLDGFHIASYFETENTTTCESHIFILVYISHLIFTFVQTFFLFKNHKLVIDKNKASVRFGLMHLLATNLCVWFITAVTETAEDYRQQDFLDNRNESNPPAVKSCYEDMTLARTASPYLFPCTIIYSIIAAGIVYRMYTYVGIKVKQRWPSHTSLTSSAAPQGVVSMDCEKANKGLFSGLLIAVVTLIAIATFFVFDSRLNNPMTATKVFFVMEISLLILTGGCIVVGKLRFQKLRFLENYLSLDSVLLLVSLAGAYIYLCFMLISSASTLESYGVVSILSLVTITVGLVQSTLQAIFILDGLCRRAENDMQVENKPGRAVVTFVLVCNLALWVVTLFEIRKTIVVPFHRSFYGILPWNIILHLCVPLYIYFRFHSAICLSKIWFNAYQKGDKYA